MKKRTKAMKLIYRVQRNADWAMFAGFVVMFIASIMVVYFRGESRHYDELANICMRIWQAIDCVAAGVTLISAVALFPRFEAIVAIVLMLVGALVLAFFYSAVTIVC